MRQYQQVTDRIIAMLEAGTRPWAQSWAAGTGCGRPRRVDGQPYRGANTVNLWAAAMERGFQSNYWMTYKAATAAGAQVRKGAKSECAFYVGSIQRQEQRKGEEVDVTIPFLKSYCVFNADEIDGLDAHYYAAAPVLSLDPSERIERADEFMGATGASIIHGGGRAFFRPSTDEIHMPEFGAFDSAAAYYGIAFHELGHWTGAEQRLNRLPKARYGDPVYGCEELVAELTAAYVCADLEISQEPREDHASYIAGWLKLLREDNRAIFRAAADAERAAGFLHAAAASVMTEDEAIAA